MLNALMLPPIPEDQCLPKVLPELFNYILFPCTKPEHPWHTEKSSSKWVRVWGNFSPGNDLKATRSITSVKESWGP